MILLDGEGLFDQELGALIRRVAPELIFETLATLEIKSISALAEALGVTRDRMAGLLNDLDIKDLFREIQRHGPKRRPPVEDT